MATSLSGIADLYGLYQAARGENSTKNSTCDRLIQHHTFYYWVMLPAISIIFVLMWFVMRSSFKTNVLKGRFAILIPMNFLDDRGYRLAYSAVFGLAASLCLKMILKDYPVDIPGPAYVRVLVKIATMLLYGFALYPMLACLTMNTILSLALGTLYTWMFFIIHMIHVTDCADDWYWEFYMSNVFMQSLPELLCSLFLAILFPFRFIQRIVRKVRNMDKEDTQEFFEDSYQAKYVRNLFRMKPKWCDDGSPKPNFKQKICLKVKAATYTQVPGFRYTPRIMATYTCGMILLYLIAMYTGRYIITHVDAILNPLDRLIGKAISPEILTMVYSNHSLWLDPVADLIIIHHWLTTGKICIILAMCLACFLGILQVALGLRAYRGDIITAWRGDLSRIGKRRGYPSLMVGFVRYSGYQVAYIFWAFILQFAFLAIVLCALSFVILIPAIYGKALWFLHWLRDFWPVLAISMTITILSKIVARFLFLQQKGKMFALDNRRLLFTVMYFLFFYNVFVGLFSCLLRMIKAILFGLFFLSRLDCSTLPKKFEKMDPGFKAYVGLIHVENAHTNPVLLTFVNMVKEEVDKVRKEEEVEAEALKESYMKLPEGGSDGDLAADLERQKAAEAREEEKRIERRRRAMKAQWFLAYTLINNLPLRATRKHYIDAEKERIQRRFRKNVESEDGIELEEVEVDGDVNADGDVLKEKLEADMDLDVKVDLKGNGNVRDRDDGDSSTMALSRV